MAVIRQDLVDYLRKSCSLADPTIETDPAYKFTDEELEESIQNVVYAYCGEYSLITLPSSYMQGIILLSRKEILWSLAFSTAPLTEYQLDEVRDKQNLRFDHYMALIEATEKEIDRLRTSGTELFSSPIIVGNLHVPVNSGSDRTYNATPNPAASLTVKNITENTADLEWNKYENPLLSEFNYYAIYTSSDSTPIYDEYTGELNPELNGILLKKITDCHITKFRLTGLQSGATMRVLLVVCSLHGLKGYSEKSFTTGV